MSKKGITDILTVTNVTAWGPQGTVNTILPIMLEMKDNLTKANETLQRIDDADEVLQEVLHNTHKLTTLLNTPGLNEGNVNALNSLIEKQLARISD